LKRVTVVSILRKLFPTMTSQGPRHNHVEGQMRIRMTTFSCHAVKRSRSKSRERELLLLHLSSLMETLMNSSVMDKIRSRNGRKCLKVIPFRRRKGNRFRTKYLLRSHAIDRRTFSHFSNNKMNSSRESTKNW
jgi:hypothetical protein